MRSSNTSFINKIKKDVIVCTKLTVVLGIVFIVINQQFTVKGMAYVFFISAMYSFVLGLGNGVINEYLTTKWDWVKETNKRVWAGIIATFLYTVSAVLVIHYIQYILLFGYDINDFFKGFLNY